MVTTGPNPRSDGSPGDESTECPQARELMRRWSAGDSEALAELLPIVYRELRRLAGRLMADERNDHTLQPTALVHEVFLRLLGEHGPSLRNRRHFLAIAARAMRRILVEHARRRGAQRRGGLFLKVELDENHPTPTSRTVDFIAIDEALQQLESLDSRRSRVVELRFFAGLTLDETAEALGVTQATVVRDWRLARAFLECTLSDLATG